MKWITRERPKIDRIACPWLVTRFIDQEPEFLYVPSSDVLSKAPKPKRFPTTFRVLSSRTKASYAASTRF